MALYHAERLKGVHPDLVRLFVAVGQSRDCEVIQGARSVDEERADITKGVSKLKNPLDSKHVVDPETRPLALAVDVAPLPLDWTNKNHQFEDFGATVKATAVVLGIAVTWGGDWHTFKDLDHFEKP